MIEAREPSNKSVLFHIFWIYGQKITCRLFYFFKGSKWILKEKIANSLLEQKMLKIGASDRLL